MADKAWLRLGKWRIQLGDQPEPDNMLTIDGITYTFVSRLGPRPHEVLIGQSVEATMNNLIMAVRGDRTAQETERPSLLQRIWRRFTR